MQNGREGLGDLVMCMTSDEESRGSSCNISSKNLKLILFLPLVKIVVKAGLGIIEIEFVLIPAIDCSHEKGRYTSRNLTRTLQMQDVLSITKPCASLETIPCNGLRFNASAYKILAIERRVRINSNLSKIHFLKCCGDLCRITNAIVTTKS